MNQIILIFAFFGSAVLCEEVARKPKLFFVSTSATTSTLQTASICYVTSDSRATCTGRKRGTISLDGMSFSEKKKITKITCLPFKCFTTNILGFEI
jgi:hypothetical protein